MIAIAMHVVGALACALGELPGQNTKAKLQSDEEDEYGDSVEGVGPKKRPIKIATGKVVVRDSDFDPQGPNWADSTASVNYNEELIFQDARQAIQPIYSATGSRQCWGFAHAGLFWFNEHAIGTIAKVGTLKVGPKKVSRVVSSDLAYFHIDGIKMSQLACPMSEATPGETIYRLNSNGVETSYSVRQARKVGSPNGGFISVILLEGPETSSGDCGLPYFRRVGRSVELLGFHSGMLADEIMMSPVCLPKFQIAGDKTNLYRTMLSENLCPKEFGPSSKTTDQLASDQLIKRQMALNFIIQDPPKNVDLENLSEVVGDMIESFTGKCDFWSERAAIRSLRLNTSAGPSFKTQKNQVFNEDFEVRPSYEKIYNQRKKLDDNLATVVIKDELRPIEKIEVGGSRLIYSYNTPQVVKAKQLVMCKLSSFRLWVRTPLPLEFPTRPGVGTTWLVSS
jgi:hypothetical protein